MEQKATPITMCVDLQRRIRRELHYGVAEVLYYSGILTLRRFLRRLLGHKNETCVLALHRVLDDKEIHKSMSLAGMILREGTFDDLLAYLQEHFQVVSLGEFLNNKSGHAEFRKPACLLTFDDGWRDNFTTALPYLEKHRMPAVVFLITGLINTQDLFWVERLNRVWRNPDRHREIQSELLSLGVPENRATDFTEIVEYLKHMPAARREHILSKVCSRNREDQTEDSVDRMASWEEIQKMSRDGVEFGAHTVTHPLLVYEEESVVVRELNKSKQAIEARLGTSVKAFAYPNGSWDERVRELVEQAGFECAFTTERGWYEPPDDPYSIKRIMIHDGVVTGRSGRFSPAMLELRLSGWF